MNSPSTPPAATSFDPFGEPVSPSVACASMGNQGDRLARRVGGAVFWTLALLILCGRVYAYDIPVVSNTVAQIAQVFAAL